MVLNRLKKIRDELKESATSYDEAFKNTALIAAETLAKQDQSLELELTETKALVENKNQQLPISLTKEYFIHRYGSLKNTKEAYTKAYGNQKYGRSWQDFLDIAAKLPLIEQPKLSLEERVTRIENILKTMGYLL